MEAATNLYIMPDTKELDKKVPDVIVKANSFKITSQEDYVQAVEFGKGIKKMIDEVNQTFEKPIDLAHKAHKSMVAARNKHLNPLEGAIDIMRRITGLWVQEQKKIADAAAKKAQAEADAEAERVRQADLKKKEDERLTQAVELEKLGFKQEADAVLDAPIAAAPVATQVVYTAPAVEKVAGVSYRPKYEFEIVDINLIDRKFLMVDEVKIRKMVNALGAEFKEAGIRVVEKTQMNFSGR